MVFERFDILFNFHDFIRFHMISPVYNSLKWGAAQTASIGPHSGALQATADAENDAVAYFPDACREIYGQAGHMTLRGGQP